MSYKSALLEWTDKLLLICGVLLLCSGIGIFVSNEDLRTAGIVLLSSGCLLILSGVVWFILKRSYEYIRPGIIKHLREQSNNYTEEQILEGTTTKRQQTSSFINAENIINETLTKEYMIEMERQISKEKKNKRKLESSPREVSSYKEEAMLRISTIQDPNWSSSASDFEY